MIYKERGTHFIRAFQFGVDPNEVTIKKAIEVAPPQMTSKMCNECGQSIALHGVYDNNLICPGSYIVHSRGKVINIINNSDFHRAYVKVECEDAEEVNDKNNNSTEESKEDKEGQEVS